MTKSSDSCWITNPACAESTCGSGWRVAGEIRQREGGPLGAEQKDRESFFHLSARTWTPVGDFVRHEIAYGEATGDLIRGGERVDITDTALLRAYRESIKDLARGEVRSWLIKLAIEQLETEIKRSRLERTRLVRIEEDIPETPPAEQVSTLGDEILDFYQPDEA